MNEEHPLHMLDNQADPEKKPTIIIQKPIRTYESDVADALAKNKTTVATMVIAKKDKEFAEQKFTADSTIDLSQNQGNAGATGSSSGVKKIALFFISLILIGGGLGGGYYLYLQSPLAPHIQPRAKVKIPSIITPDIQTLLPVGGGQSEVFISTLHTSFLKYSVNPGNIVEAIPTHNVGSTTYRVTGSEFIDRLGVTMPDVLKRSLTDRYMLGLYGVDDVESGPQKLPFILFTSDFFQNSFAGMLSWEKDMPDQLASFFAYTETGTQTGDHTSSFFGIRGKFEDATIHNRDVREFRDEQGQVLLVYSFIDKNTLAITSSEATLNGLIDHIEKQNYIR